MCGEEDQVVEEDAGPYRGYEEDDACLSDYCGAWAVLAAVKKKL
jgi:hypothetical protein